MKKLTLFFFSAFIAISLYGQNHLQFMGIEISGDESSFVHKLTDKGFKLIQEFEEGGSLMEGVFAGEKVELYVIVTPSSKQVRKVGIYFPENESWYSIKQDYFKFKDYYAQKYPLSNDFEFFSQPYYEGDGYEMQAVRAGKCHYASFFKTELGTIQLNISKFKKLSVSYEDAENTQTSSEESSAIILDEI